jgi:segregation and condensation protein B
VSEEQDAVVAEQAVEADEQVVVIDIEREPSALAEPSVDETQTSDDLSLDEVMAVDAADARQPSAELKAIVEALIFASPDPLSLKAIAKLLEDEPKDEVQLAIEGLKQDYERPGGLQFVEVAGGYQIVTRPDLHEWVRRLFHERTTQKLSVPALETLAVVAYRQPVTALEVQEIRGVNTSGVMNTLLERGLVKIVGRKQVVGRPFMYATTREFLIRFGLNDLADLPKVEDMAEALGIETPLLTEQLPPEEELPLLEPEDASFDASSAVEESGEEPRE